MEVGINCRNVPSGSTMVLNHSLASIFLWHQWALFPHLVRLCGICNVRS